MHNTKHTYGHIITYLPLYTHIQNEKKKKIVTTAPKDKNYNKLIPLTRLINSRAFSQFALGNHIDSSQYFTRYIRITRV